MKQFKKRTLALILASTITVVGAFGAENYKNSLMSLKLESDDSNAVNVTLQTKQEYTNTITPTKKDASTYVIMLPETDGREAKTPELVGNVQSVNISTMPYTQSGNGYTKITIKTAPNTNLTAKKALYIEDRSRTGFDSYAQEQQRRMEQRARDEERRRIEREEAERKAREEAKNENSFNSEPPAQNDFSPTVQESKHQFEPQERDSNSDSASEKNTQPSATKQSPNQTNNNDTVLFVLGGLFIVLACVFFYIKGRNKMAEIVGEDMDFSLEEEKDKKNQKQKKRIRKTISALDKMYEKPVKMPVNIQPTADMPELNTMAAPTNLQDDADNNVVLDLDELFQEKNSVAELSDSDSDNVALDDFLSGFDFDLDEENNYSELETMQQVDEDALINEMFEKYIQNGVVKFSEADVEKINELINIEISDETLNNLDQYVVTNPIQQKKAAHTEILENLITTYTINQNISFTKDDVDALDKISQVELDSDFVTDLTTDPKRTKQMQKEIESRQVSHKNREILTLNVKNLLPDLSEALKKQGGKRIESEVKPQVVYYSEGYDVSTLSVGEDLPDLVLDFDNPEYNKYRPSDEVEIVAQGYEVQTLTIKDELPDLSDAMANPEKYNDKKEKVSVDEDALLKNIQNVQFKPFYDGYENFEISDKFDNDTTFVEENESDSGENKENESYTQSNVHTEYVRNSRHDENAKKLLELIENQQNERKLKAQNSLKDVIEGQTKSIEVPEKQKTEKQVYVVDGQNYEILSTSVITDVIGCHLAHGNEGYTILGYIGDKIFKIKYYETLNTQKIQSRLNETLDNGKVQYIVRIGLHKFILNISGDNMEYIMDLC